jgi:arabinofuranosyltransferase
MAYLGLLWWMMVCWSQAGRGRPPGPVFIGALAFVAGCSVLVRPELTLIGGLALIMMLIAARGRRRRTLIVVAGGLLPVGYQIFRMGYYGLLFPGTALAKDAAGDKWSQGLIYLSNFNRPYALWVPALLLGALGLVLRASARRRKAIRVSSPVHGPLARGVQSPFAVVVFILVSGLLQALYWIRQGGDFMHGRVLLAPLMCLLAPVAVVPVVFPEGTRLSREAGYWLAGAVSALWMSIAGWAPTPPGSPTRASWTSGASTRRRRVTHIR